MEKQEKVLMGQRELKRWHLKELVKGGKITLREAGEKIGVSYRQSKRIVRAIREREIRGVTPNPTFFQISMMLNCSWWKPGLALITIFFLNFLSSSSIPALSSS